MTTEGPSTPACAQVTFRDVIARDPAALAVEDGDVRLTYGDVDQQVGRVAAAIVRARGDQLEPAVVLARDSVSYLRAALGAVRAGRTIVPLDPHTPESRLRAIVEALEPSAIVTAAPDVGLAARLARDGDTVIDVGDVVSTGAPMDGWLDRDPRSVYRITFTSGSTGRPKGVPRDHSAAKGTPDDPASRPQPGDRVPVLFSGARSGIGSDPLRVLLRGATVLPFALRDEGIARFARWLLEVNPTVLETVPTVLRHVARALPAGSSLGDLRVIRVGGEALFWPDVHRLRAHTPPGCRWWVRYGASEAGLITVYELPVDGPREGVVPVGKPGSDVQVRIVDDDGHEVPSGTVGQIVVTAARLARSYLASETPERFTVTTDGVPEFATGDLGRIDPDTGVLTHIGRADGMVKIHGQRVELTDVAAALIAHPAVEAVDVQAVEGAAGDLELVAFVATGGSGLDAVSVTAHARELLPASAVPQHVATYSALPSLPNGKVDRVGLREGWQRERALATAAVHASDDERAFAIKGPRDDVEIAIRETVERLSGMAVPDGSVSLLDLGVDSIHLASVFAMLEARFGVDLPVSTVIGAPSPRALAAVVHQGATAWPLVVPVRTTGGRSPLFVVHGGRGNVVYAWPLAELLGEDRPTYALQHPALDGHPPAELTVVELATSYADALLEARPVGPYALAGMSGGGVIAFEIARVLKGRGHDVVVVVMFDSALPSGEVRPPAARRRNPKWSRRIRNTSRRRARTLLTQWDLRVRRRLRPALRPAWIMGWMRAAFRTHTVEPLDVPVVMVRAGLRPDQEPDDRGWGRLAPTVAVRASGVHGQLMRPPNLLPNGGLLRAALAWAEHEPAATDGADPFAELARPRPVS